MDHRRAVPDIRSAVIDEYFFFLGFGDDGSRSCAETDWAKKTTTIAIALKLMRSRRKFTFDSSLQIIAPFAERRVYIVLASVKT
jgi:hypothetical protein